MWNFQKQHITLIFIIILCSNFERITSRKHGIKSYDSGEQSEEIACDNEFIRQNNGTIYIWKTKYRNDPTPYSTSDKQICLNSRTNKLLIRKCNPLTGEWLPQTNSIKCAPIQKQRNVFCPEDLIEISINRRHGEFICLKLSNDASVFDEKFCYGSNTLFGEKSMNAEEKLAILIYLKNKRHINRFWLPVKRATYNKYYNPFIVNLPGSQWGEIYEMPNTIKELFDKDKNCLSAEIIINNNNNNNGKQIEFHTQMTNCNESLPMVCIFRNEEIVAYSGCPQGFGALSYKPNECFGIEWEAGLFPYDLHSLSIVDFISQQNSLQRIFDSIGLEPERFFLIGNFTDDINEQHFDIEMNSQKEFRIIPFGGKRHALSFELLTNQNRKSVEMVLGFNEKLDGLVLTIYNRNYIWRFSDDDDNYGVKCFTNSKAETIQWKTLKIKILWQNTLETKALFELKNSNNEGYYWCEAHTIFEFSIIKTEKIIVKRQKKKNKGHTFAILLDLYCVDEMECFNLYSSNTWKHLNKKSKEMLKNTLNDRKKEKKFEDLEIFNVRLMDIFSILNFNNGTNLIKSLIHVTASLKSSRIDQDSSIESSEEFDDDKENDFGLATTVRLKVLQLLNDMAILINTKMAMLLNTKILIKEPVRSTIFCFPEIFYMNNQQENFWQLSQIGQTSTANKLCLQKYDIPIVRSCLGDYLWGAYWENVVNRFGNRIQCNLRKQTDIITYELRDIEKQKLPKISPTKTFKNVRKLLDENLKKLIPADFYYISRIMQTTMKNLLKINNDNLTTENTNKNIKTNEAIGSEVAQIYNYLMKVNEKIVKSSAMLNSTNVLLEVFERLIDEIALEIKMEKNSLRNNSTNSASTIYENKIIEKIDGSIKTRDYDDVGVIVKISSNFVIFIIDPTKANITGIALYSKKDEDSSTSNEEIYFDGTLEGLFKNEIYRFILANQSVDDLMYERNLQLATYIPESLWQRLDEISKEANLTTGLLTETRFVIKIYANDVLFQEQKNKNEINDRDENSNDNEKIVAGKIISVSIPGHDKDLPEMLPLIFKLPKESDNDNDKDNDKDKDKANDKDNTTASFIEPTCSYWNYNSWADDGLSFLGRSEYDPSLILCGCTHLTPFAYLIGNNYKFSIDTNSDFDLENEIYVEKHRKALDLITILGCSLSLFGTIGIFVTAVTFQSWRQKASSKVLLQLSSAISLQMVLFCFVNTAQNAKNLIDNDIFSSCIAIGALLHYSVLVQFSWMIIIGYLQFKRYVQVFGNTRPTRFFKKSSIIGWGAPMIPVMLVLIFDRKSYIPATMTNNIQSICYPSGYSLYFGVLFPITLIIIANFIIFSIIIHNILKGPEGTLRHTEKSLALSQLRLSILLFFLLGFTWIFGLLANLRIGIIFSYLFCLTATLQGFVIFIYFVILDPKTRRMWRGFFYNVCGLKENYETSSSSTKDTTQTLR